MLEHPLRVFRFVLGKARQYKSRRAFLQGESMKNSKDDGLLRITANHNYFIRSVICKIASQVAITLFWVLCISAGFVMISQPFGQILAFIGGIIGIAQIISIFSVIKEINSLHQKVTKREDEIVYETLHQSQEYGEKK